MKALRASSWSAKDPEKPEYDSQPVSATIAVLIAVSAI